MRSKALWTVACALVLFVSYFTTGCAAVDAPVNGHYYTGVRGPLQGGGHSEDVNSSKVGESSVSSILGLVAFGDASIEAAAKNGEITKISHVDYKAFSLLGFYATYTTVVYGE